MAKSKVQSVAIIGASGNLGSLVLKAIMQESNLTVTVITRHQSTAIFPTDARITVQKGDYDAPDFFKESLEGKDVLIITLGLSAPPNVTSRIYDAAASAGIKWVIPSTFGCDWRNAELVSRVRSLAMAGAAMTKIAELGLGCVGFVTNPWLDFNIGTGYFSIDVMARKASLYRDGDAKFNVTTVPQVALALARFLSLCADPASGLAIEDFREKALYISSFLVSQPEILESVLRVTRTRREDWTVDDSMDVASFIAGGDAKMKQGEYMAGVLQSLFGNMYLEGAGGDYETTGRLSNELLGLPKEDLDQVIKQAIMNMDMRV